MGSHYDTLGVPRDADDATIKAAHRRLAQQHHPDKTGGDDEAFKAIQAAYDTLKDADKRAYYDRTGHDQPRARNEFEDFAPLVVGAFDRAVEQAQKGSFTLGMQRGLGRTHIIRAMEDLLNADKQRGAAAIKSLDDSVKQMEEMRRRLGFTGEQGGNIIDTVLSQRIRDAGEMRAKNEATIALIDKAIVHVKLYGWEVDPAPADLYMHFHTGGSFTESYLEEIFRRRVNDVFGGIPKRPITINVGPRAPAKPRRRATDTSGRRPHTCTLDAEGRQVPPPRGSWAGFERRVAAIQGS